MRDLDMYLSLNGRRTRLILRLKSTPAGHLGSGGPEEFHFTSRRVSTKRERQQSHSRASTGFFVGGCFPCGALVCGVPGSWLCTRRFARNSNI